jgi:hypothetical protein
MEFVQVDKASLLEYIAYVEYLNEDHTKIRQRLKDTEEIAKMLEATYKARIDKLLDLILEQPNRSDYYKGLHAAYELLKGRG